MKGKIKWYNDELGYGFITSEGGTDYFVHKSGVDSDWKPFEGAGVLFEEGEGKKGPKAINVRPEPK